MRRAWLGILLALPPIFSGCATGAVRQVPDRGKLTVGVTTTGRPTPASFHVTADAGVFINDHLPDGEHVVRLAVPPNCRADAGTERKITISPQRRSAVLRFEVRCS
jgi:hypothetical protein